MIRSDPFQRPVGRVVEIKTSRRASVVSCEHNYWILMIDICFFSEWGDWLLWWWFWWIVVWWANHSFDLEHVGALERFDDFANTFVELVKHPGELTTVQVLRWETCTSERVHYCSVKWTYASVYPHWYQFLVSYLDVAVSLDCIFRGLYNVQCANVDITASVQCLIPSLAFNFSNGKCKTKLNNFH